MRVPPGSCGETRLPRDESSMQRPALKRADYTHRRGENRSRRNIRRVGPDFRCDNSRNPSRKIRTRFTYVRARDNRPSHISIRRKKGSEKMTELAYLRRRLEEERALAAQITHRPEQRFHQRLGDLYQLRIRSLANV